MKLSKPLIAGIVAAVAVLIVVMMVVLAYNDMVSKDQGVENSWSNIETRVQKLIDKIPLISAAMNLSIEFQENLLTNITLARTQWLSSIGNIAEQVNASIAMNQNLTILVATYENYPQLDLSLVQAYAAEVSSILNEINSARIFYNDAVREYNTAIRSFPNVMFAGSFGFEKAVYYEQGM